MYDEVAARAGEIADRLDRTGERIDELRCELAEQRVTWRSDDELYAIAVDGNGRLLDLEIAPGALVDAHLDRVGSHLVAAIGAARAAAVAVGRRRWEEEFGSTTMLDGLLPEIDEPDGGGSRES